MRHYTSDREFVRNIVAAFPKRGEAFAIANKKKMDDAFKLKNDEDTAENVPFSSDSVRVRLFR